MWSKRVEPDSRKLSNQAGYTKSDQDVVDLVSEAVILAGVTNFVGVESSAGIGVLHKHGEVDVRVAEHFQELVTGGKSPGSAGFQIGWRVGSSVRQVIRRVMGLSECA